MNPNESYRGEWLNNMFHGEGEFRYYDGRIYTGIQIINLGQWKKGL